MNKTKVTSSITPLCCLGALVTLFGCASDDITFTKEAAKDQGGLGSDGRDLCADNGWYGDGECDVFCPAHDKDDCDMACAAVLPACDEGKREVSEQECELLPGCQKITSCGGTVYCADDELVACPAVEPTCTVDGEQVPPLDASECNVPDACTRHEACGGRVYYCPRDDGKENPKECFIGGCSSQLCTDDPGAVSDCAYREEYACYKTASCARQDNGECGWTQTEELKACLGEANEPTPVAPCHVGGCSGQLCSDGEDGISTCEWKEEYACYKKATCERQDDGQCGWTQTAELQACIDMSI